MYGEYKQYQPVMEHYNYDQHSEEDSEHTLHEHDHVQDLQLTMLHSQNAFNLNYSDPQKHY